MKTLTRISGLLALAAAVVYTVIRMRRAPAYPPRAIPREDQRPGARNLPAEGLRDAEVFMDEPSDPEDLRVARNSPL